MRNAIVTGSLISLIFGVLGCSDDAEDDVTPGSETADACAESCARSVGCAEDPLDDCVSSCQLAATLCPAEAAVVIACLQSRPDSDLHCDEESQMTVLNDGVCAAEQIALFTCVGDDADL